MPQLTYIQWVEVIVIAAILIVTGYVCYSLNLFGKGK
jgi:hypothetical protein